MNLPLPFLRKLIPATAYIPIAGPFARETRVSAIRAPSGFWLFLPLKVYFARN